MLCLLPSSWFRAVSWLMQCLAITTLLLLLLMYPLVSAHLRELMQGNVAIANWLPPVWFLGLDEGLLLGNATPAGAWHLASLGLYATGGATLLALVTYPLAWARQRKHALEGASATRGRRRKLCECAFASHAAAPAGAESDLSLHW